MASSPADAAAWTTLQPTAGGPSTRTARRENAKFTSIEQLGRVVKAADSEAGGRGFESGLAHFSLAATRPPVRHSPRAPCRTVGPRTEVVGEAALEDARRAHLANTSQEGEAHRTGHGSGSVGSGTAQNHTRGWVLAQWRPFQPGGWHSAARRTWRNPHRRGPQCEAPQAGGCGTVHRITVNMDRAPGEWRPLQPGVGGPPATGGCSTARDATGPRRRSHLARARARAPPRSADERTTSEGAQRSPSRARAKGIQTKQKTFFA